MTLPDGWLPSSLRARLLALLVLAALPVAGVMVVTAFQMRAAAFSDTERDLLEMIHYVAAKHREMRSAAEQTLRTVARLPAVTSGDSERCSRVLAQIVERGGLFYNIVLFDLDGRRVCDGREVESSVNVSDRAYFRRALRTRGFASGNYDVGIVTSKPIVGFALPLMDDAGQPRFVLYTNLWLSKFIEAIPDVDLLSYTTVTLIDPAFNVLVRSPPDETVDKSIVGTEMQQALVKHGGVPAVRAFGGLTPGKRIHAYTSIRHDGELLGYAVVSVPEAFVTAPANKALWRELFILVLVVAAMSAIIFLGANALVLKRVGALLQVTRRIAGGDLAARAPAARDSNEISVLENAFNDMADKNEQALDHIARLSRLYAVLSAINSAIVYLRERRVLANEACRIAVETGNYAVACIFLIDKGTRLARMAGHAGAEKDHYEALTINIDAPPMPGDGPLSKALRTGAHFVEQAVEDSAAGGQRSRVLERALQSGHHALAAFPLIVRGQTIGALQLWTTSPDAFDAEEERLLLQLAADVSLGMEHIDREAELRESEERFRETFNQAAVGIVHVSTEGRFLHINQKYADIVGYTREELLAKTFQEITYPADLDADLLLAGRLLRGEIASYDLDKRYIRRDGGIVWVHLTVSLVRGANGAPRYFVAVAEDISAGKTAEQALMEGERRYRELFEANPHPMYVYDLETLRFLAVNDAAISQYGYSREEFLGMNIKDIRPPEEVPALVERLKALPPGVHEVLRRHLKKDGALIEVEITSHALDFAGHHARVVLAQDVTARRCAERALAEAEEKFRGLVEQSLMGIYIVDAENVRYANPRSAEIFGYSQEELATVSLQALVHEEDWPLVRDNILRGLKGELTSLRQNFRGRRKDGSLVHIGTHGMRAQLAGQWRVIGVLQDITEKLHAEAQIAEYVQRLERSVMATVEAVSRMVELRDPYTSGHERRVGEIAAAIAAEMGLDENIQQGLRITGYVHDIGKITLPAEILSKPGRLSAIEFEMVKSHAEQGYKILKPVDFPWPVAETVLQHHERLDGSGYPNGLKGEEIRLEARILAVADVIEAMATHRPYRPAHGLSAALDEIARGVGTVYDADVTNAAIRLFKEKGFQLPA